MNRDSEQVKEEGSPQDLETRGESELLPIEILEQHLYVLHRAPLYSLQEMADSLYTDEPVPYEDISLMAFWDGENRPSSGSDKYFATSRLGLGELLLADRFFLTAQVDKGDGSFYALYQRVKEIENRIVYTSNLEVPDISEKEEEDKEALAEIESKKILVAGVLSQYVETLHQFFDALERRFKPEDVYELALREKQKAINKLGNINNRSKHVRTDRDSVMRRNLTRSIKCYERAIMRAEAQIN